MIMEVLKAAKKVDEFFEKIILTTPYCMLMILLGSSLKHNENTFIIN